MKLNDIQQENERLRNENTTLKARISKLESIMNKVKDDLLLRADVDSDGARAVNVSNGIWSKFCDVLNETPWQSLNDIQADAIKENERLNKELEDLKCDLNEYAKINQELLSHVDLDRL